MKIRLAKHPIDPCRTTTLAALPLLPSFSIITTRRTASTTTAGTAARTNFPRPASRDRLLKNRVFALFAITLSLFLISLFCLPALAHASCVNPTGKAGDTTYNGGSRTYEYCDGASWVAMGPVGDVRTGLVGYWKFDDASSGNALTTATDSSGNGYTATLKTSGSTCTGGTNCPTWTTGINGNALTFNGTTQEADVASITGITNTFTVAFWEKTSVTSSQILWEMSAYASCKVDYSGHNIGCSVQANTATTIAGTAIDDGQWHHVAYVVNNTAQTLYVDGTAQATGTETPAGLPSSSCFGSGNCWGTSSWFNGTMDDVRIYNRALAAHDIKTLYTSTGPLSGDINTGLVGWWKFDDGTSGSTPTTAADSSGNGNTGTLTNSPTWTSSGKINDALTFNGTNYVTVPSAANLNLNNFTIATWIKYTTVPSGSQAWIVEKDTGSATYNYNFYYDPSGPNLVCDFNSSSPIVSGPSWTPVRQPGAPVSPNPRNPWPASSFSPRPLQMRDQPNPTQLLANP